MLTLETCGDFPFLETCFTVRITGKRKQHFNCCSIILKFNVEGKKLTNLYRYIYRGSENKVKYVLNKNQCECECECEYHVYPGIVE